MKDSSTRTARSPSSADLIQVEGQTPFRLRTFASIRKAAPGADYADRAVLVDGSPITLSNASELSDETISIPGTFIAVQRTPSTFAAIRKVMSTRGNLGLLREAEKATICEALADDLKVRWTLEQAAPLRGLHERFRAGHTTYDPTTLMRIGLHLDSWTDMGDRAIAPNRVCVNAGEHPRLFLFHAERLDVFAERYAGSDAAAAFERDFERRALAGEVRVFGVETEPGEAYIAPTDNLIHDGWFKGAGQDVSYAVRGIILPRGSSKVGHRWRYEAMS
jgi:hypothetical protein